MFRKRILLSVFLGLLVSGLVGTLTAQLRRTGGGLTGHIEMLGGAVLPIGAYADANTGGGAQAGFIIGPQANFKLKRVESLLISVQGAYQQNNTQINVTGLTADPWKIFWLLGGVTWQFPINDDETNTFELGALLGPAFISAPTIGGPGGSLPGQSVTGFGSNLNLALRFAVSESATFKLGVALQSTRAQYSSRSTSGVTVQIDQPIGSFNIFAGIGFRLRGK